MTSLRRVFGFAATLAVLYTAPSASALPSSSGADKTQGASAEAWAGGGTSSVVQGARNVFSLASGLSGVYHFRWLELGGELTDQSILFTADALVAAGLVGLRIAPSSRVRFEILSEWGVDDIQIEPGLLSSGSGGSASLPYVGGRVGMTLVARGRWHFVVGWWANAGDALGSSVVTSHFSSCFIFCGDYTQTNTVGGFGWAMSGRIGIESAEW